MKVVEFIYNINLYEFVAETAKKSLQNICTICNTFHQWKDDVEWTELN